MKKVNVFVPSHITGFFSIQEATTPLQTGSKGAGILLNRGVTTSIQKNPNNEETNISINADSNPEKEAIIRKTIELMKSEFNFKDNFTINQNINVPVGCGFGTSGASALSTSLALIKLLKLPISPIKAGQYAHLVEVSLGTGLGDVLAEMEKGLVFRIKPGAPGYGECEVINTDNELYIITKSLGSIKTKNIITNSKQKEKITKIGSNMEEKFLKLPSIRTFLKYSYQFSEETELLNPKVKKIIEDLNTKTFGASMAMLGNTAFAITDDISEIDPEEYTISKLYNDGIKYLEKGKVVNDQNYL
ncbi:pantoate kinase [Methanobrevibacter sp. UBA417]|jgi:pantoate kinase|uniref:pantoate kinase n=1 Tax=Methanobrevibacter sp. UBA417 TaxID=1915487 RepID=UPI0039B85E99